MANFKRGKPKKYAKVYRGGVDGPDCAFCGSNWKYTSGTKSITLKFLYETTSSTDAGLSNWRLS